MKLFRILLVIFLIFFAYNVFLHIGNSHWQFNTDNKSIIINNFESDLIDLIKQNITIPSSLDGMPITSIKNNTFYGCKWLKSITIPSTISSIEKSAFNGCERLENIHVDKNNANYCSIDGILYSKDKSKLLFCPAGKKDNIIIPNNVTSFDPLAFSRCKWLENIHVDENNLTFCSIGGILYDKDKSKLLFCPAGKKDNIIIPNNVTNIDPLAFSRCKWLENIHVDENNLTFCSIGGILYDKGKSYLIRCPQGKKEQITIPNSVTGIGKNAFANCYRLKKITVPNSVTNIGEGAFIHCYNLRQITISNSVTSIEERTFANCYRLKKITIPNNVTTIKNEAFSDCYKLKRIIIPNSVTNIGEWAFYHCEKLKKIIIPDRITSIKKGTFADCYRLKSITIPNSVTNIGAMAFSDCYNLKKITIPNSVINIGEETFSHCKKLKSIILYNDITNIGKYSFDYCENLESIKVPSQAVNYYKGLVNPKIHNKIIGY